MIKKITYLFLIYFLFIFSFFYFYKISLIVVPITIEDIKIKNIEKISVLFNIDKEMATAFFNAGKETNIDPILLASIAFVESEFKLNAISNKGYKSIMQTKEATMKFANVDILKGAMELKYWLKKNNNNIEKALVHYNGGNNPPYESKKYMYKVLSIYKEKKQIIKEV